MRVRCHKNQHPDGRLAALTPGELYEVIGIEADDFRVIDDTGSPVLFERVLFEIVDPSRPPDWITEQLDGAEYASPPELNTPGFWEDYFEHDPGARLAFSRFLNQRLRATGAA